jgi:hypothetical protein
MFFEEEMVLNKEILPDLLANYKGPFEKEITFYVENLDTLLAKYKGRHIIISGDTVIGDFDSDEAALKAAIAAKLEPGTFVVRIVREKEPIQRFSNVYA